MTTFNGKFSAVLKVSKLSIHQKLQLNSYDQQKDKLKAWYS